MTARRPILLLAALALPASGCPLVERRWEGSAPLDVVPVDAAVDVVPADAVPADAAVDVGGREPPWLRGDAASSGCARAGEADLLRAGWDLFVARALEAPADFERCLRSRVFSPTAWGYAEEVVAATARAPIVHVSCGDLPPPAGGHNLARLSEGELVLGHAAFAEASAARVAGAIAHAVLDERRFVHHSGADGEAPYSVPEQADRCLREIAGDAALRALPAVHRRELGPIESEPQPFGYLRADQWPIFFHECPPGSWVAGLGQALMGSGATLRLSALGARCRAAAGATDLATGDVQTWADCAEGAVAVGLRARATTTRVYELTALCSPRASVLAGALEPVAPLPLSGGESGSVIERRCPPRQALRAVGGIAIADAILQVNALCRDLAAPPIGNHVDLPSVGARSPYPGIHTRRRGRCGDQGVLTGLYGHVAARAASRDIVRLGGVCRGTELVSAVPRFRVEPSGELAPEHIVPGTGGPTTSLETPFAARCPAGMGAVGLRTRNGGSSGTPQHLQVLCAPLSAWAGSAPVTPTRVTAAGAWEVAEPPGTEERQCPRGSFLTGMMVEQAEIPPDAGVQGVVDMIEQVTPTCRALVVGP